MFQFLEINEIVDDDLQIRLVDTFLPKLVGDLVPEYFFKMYHRSSNSEIGHINARIGKSERLDYSGLIGYAVHEKFRGRRYAMRACRLILPIFKKHDLNSVVVTCNPDNIASRRTLELAGAKYLGDFQVPEWHPAFMRKEFVKSRYEFSEF